MDREYCFYWLAEESGGRIKLIVFFSVDGVLGIRMYSKVFVLVGGRVGRYG